MFVTLGKFQNQGTNAAGLEMWSGDVMVGDRTIARVYEPGTGGPLQWSPLLAGQDLADLTAWAESQPCPLSAEDVGDSILAELPRQWAGWDGFAKLELLLCHMADVAAGH